MIDLTKIQSVEEQLTVAESRKVNIQRDLKDVVERIDELEKKLRAAIRILTGATPDLFSHPSAEPPVDEKSKAEKGKGSKSSRTRKGRGR